MILGVYVLFVKFIYERDVYMKFIVLVGNGEKEKTTTQKKVIRKLIESGARSTVASVSLMNVLNSSKLAR